MVHYPDATHPRRNPQRWCAPVLDVHPESLDPERHEDFILGRVLTEGSWEMVRALRLEIGDTGLRAFLDRAPHGMDARTRRFLEVVLPPSEAPCMSTRFRRSSDALFSA